MSRGQEYIGHMMFINFNLTHMDIHLIFMKEYCLIEIMNILNLFIANSTSDATPTGNDSKPFSLQIGVIIGASLFSIILLGLIVFLVIFYMKKRTKKSKYNLKSSHGIDNPMSMYIKLTCYA